MSLQNFSKIFLLTLIFFAGVQYIQAADNTYDDLQVTSMNITSTSPLVDQTCIITITVKNAGTNNIFSNTGLGIFTKNFPDFQISKSSYALPSISSPIMPNQTTDYVFEGKFLASGTKKLEFTIDSNNDLIENNEDNNYVSKTITVLDKGQNDLAINSINIEPDPLIIGADTTIEIVVQNIGASSITNGTGLTKDDLLFDADYFNIEDFTSDDLPTINNPLASKATFTYSILGRFQNYGNSTLNANINAYKFLAENDFSNNTSALSLTIYANQAAAEDFTINDISATPLSTTSIMIKWTTTQETSSLIKYSYNNLTPNNITIDAKNTQHEYILKDLKPSVEYSYQIIATNGNTEKIISKTFYLNTNNEQLNISNENVVTDSNNKSTAISWQTNIGTMSQLYYKLANVTNWENEINSSYGLSHEFNLNNLGEGTYEYYIQNTNYQGNISTSTIRTFNLNSVENSTQTDNTASTDDSYEESDAASPVVNVINITNNSMYNRLKGKILLKVEDLGRAYYIHPENKKGYFLNTAEDAFNIMREQGVGITNADLAKIPVGFRNLTGDDSDGDGLTDAMEDALGTNKNAKDSDEDGYEDKYEITNQYNPLLKNTRSYYDNNFALQNSGRIFLQVQNKGEAWYINPDDNKRYFLGRPADAYDIMRFLSLGINNENFANLQ